MYTHSHLILMFLYSKGMHKNSRDTCSLCRKKVVQWNVDDINLIPNNSYILCMMKMKTLMNPALDETGKRSVRIVLHKI